MKKRVELVHNETNQKLVGEFYAERNEQDEIIITQRVGRDTFIQLPLENYRNYSIQLKKEQEK